MKLGNLYGILPQSCFYKAQTSVKIGKLDMKS